ncbi:hypothetical protein ATCC90586_003920 [Pythium insidiosum]|nr:hypothetical protein ATCC90586_003920 [Pythium insidiosum]
MLPSVEAVEDLILEAYNSMQSDGEYIFLSQDIADKLHHVAQLVENAGYCHSNNQPVDFNSPVDGALVDSVGEDMEQLQLPCAASLDHSDAAEEPLTIDDSGSQNHKSEPEESTSPSDNQSAAEVS